MTEKVEDNLAKAGGYILAAFIVGLVLWWENYVFFWPVLAYWKWLVMAVPVLVSQQVDRRIFRTIYATSFAVTLLAQFAAWLHIITLPLIKL